MSPFSEVPEKPVTLPVGSRPDVSAAASAGKTFALSLGFSTEQGEAIELVVTELATNLIRHASHGVITVRPARDGERSGIQIESEDDGPGIADVEEAMTDGYSTAGGLGLGLGTINRLMDDLEVSSGTTAGLRVVCRRWLRPEPDTLQLREIVFGVATRSCRLQPENGDAFIIKHWQRTALAGVVDGLGHGPLAMRASRTAKQYVEEHFDQPLDNIFQGAGRACRATRGVVMALARFDLARQTFMLANVGNIEVRLLGASEKFNAIVRRGVVGLNAPKPVCTEHAWGPSNVLVMHSDGLRPNWDWRNFQDVAGDTPDAIARRLLQRAGDRDDDATVLVAR